MRGMTGSNAARERGAGLSNAARRISGLFVVSLTRSGAKLLEARSALVAPPTLFATLAGASGAGARAIRSLAPIASASAVRCIIGWVDLASESDLPDRTTTAAVYPSVAGA